MSKEELKNKCTERAKIFQQAMESCKSSNPMDCIEWFADRTLELEKENERIKTKHYELQETLKKVRLALIQERTANIINYGKGGVEMFDNMFEILKGVSN